MNAAPCPLKIQGRLLNETIPPFKASKLARVDSGNYTTTLAAAECGLSARSLVLALPEQAAVDVVAAPRTGNIAVTQVPTRIHRPPRGKSVICVLRAPTLRSHVVLRGETDVYEMAGTNRGSRKMDCREVSSDRYHVAMSNRTLGSIDAAGGGAYTLIIQVSIGL